MLHLLECDIYRNDDIVPESVTQPGIARALDTDRSYVSFVLSQMESNDTVINKLGRIQGGKRRRKVYFLTEEGLKYAQDIRTLISGIRIAYKSKGKELNNPLGYVASEAGLSLTTMVVKMDASSVFDLDDITLLGRTKKRSPGGPRGPPVPDNFKGRKKEISIIRSWLKGSSGILQVNGIAGTGKTSLVGKALEEEIDPELTTIYIPVPSWGDDSSLMTNLSRELESANRLSLSSLQKEKGSLSLDEFARGLEQEISRKPMLLNLDDVHNLIGKGRKSKVLDLIIRMSVKDLKTILISREPLELDPRLSMRSDPPLSLEVAGLKRNDVRSLFEDHDLDFNNDIYSRTSGHPLYVNLLIQYHCQADALEPGKSIRTFIRNEVLECLNRTEMDLLDIMSVFRVPVSRERLFDLDAGDLLISESGLQSLMGGGILTGGEGSIVIHQLIKDIVLEMMPKSRSLRIHRILSEHYRERLDLQTMPVKDVSGRIIDLREYLHHIWTCGTIGERLSAISDMGEELMSRSLNDDLERYSKDMLEEISRSHEAESLDPSLMIRIMIYHGWCLSVRGEWEKALEEYDRARMKAEEIPSWDLVGRCLNAVGTIHLRRGDPENARELISRSIELMDDRRTLCKARSNLAIVQWMEGRLEEALEEVDRSLDLALYLDDAMGVSRGLINKGIILAQMNDFEGSGSAYEKALDICEREGFSQTLSIVHDNLGEIRRELGDLEASRKHFEKSLSLAADLGFRWQVAEATRNLASLTEEGPGRIGMFLESMEIFRSLGDLREVDRTEEMMRESPDKE